jgi:hypothetical protein
MARLGFRNTQTLFYAQYSDKIPILDSDGYETGEYTVGYDNPVLLDANVVDKTSQIAREYFGNDIEYKYVILTDRDCPIKEDTILWIDTDNPLENEGVEYNCIVSAIKKSLNYKAIAAKGVTGNEVQW